VIGAGGLAVAWLGRALAAAPIQEELGDGVVDWTHMRLLCSATGGRNTGSLHNLQAVEDDGRRQLGPRFDELVRRVPISRGVTGGDVLDRGDLAAARVAQDVAYWEVYEARYYASGGVELDAALPLGKVFRSALTAMAKGQEVPASLGGPSGVVIDARGLEVRPSLAPRIFDAPGGTALYGPESLLPSAATQRTPVAWVADPADAVAAGRAGKEPVFLRAAAVVGGVDLVLDSASAARMRELATATDALVQGKVVLVVDR
jgi:hypothetical protein